MKFIQEKIYDFEWKVNGAGPLWCYGSSCIATFKDKVFVTGWETLKGIPPLNCARWILYQRNEKGWKLMYQDAERTREPAPICVLSDGKIFISENPFMLESEAKTGVTLPGIRIFYPPNYSESKKVLFYPYEPVVLVEHSYRNFAADRENSELIVFQNKGYDRAYWSLIDKDGNPIKSGKIYWPWGYDYVNPQRIRICYNNVQLKNRAVYILGTSDILEPNPEWKEYKRKITGREWDYDFRRLFFTYTPDIVNKPFNYWIEISSREKTAGNIRNHDLFVDNNGFSHLIWWEKSCDDRLRDKFFPYESLTHSLKYAKLDDQKMLNQKNILFFGENEKTSSGISNISFIFGRIHVKENNELYLFVAITGTDKNKKNLAENWLFELDIQGNIKARHPVNFEKPFTQFHLTSVRNGCTTSDKIHIYGHVTDPDNEMYYGCIEL